MAIHVVSNHMLFKQRNNEFSPTHDIMLRCEYIGREILAVGFMN